MKKTMNKDLMTAMTASISEVMETMFFLPVESGPETFFGEYESEKKNSLACQLAFAGDRSGRLILTAPRALIVEMAENFMGEPEDQLTDEHLSGTLSELLNMVCGNALGKTKSKVPYELGLPKIIQTSDIGGKEKVTVIETLESKMAAILIMDES